jgi:hypothetical protein
MTPTKIDPVLAYAISKYGHRPHQEFDAYASARREEKRVLMQRLRAERRGQPTDKFPKRVRV